MTSALGFPLSNRAVRASVLALTIVAIVTGLLTTIALDSDGAQNLLLGGLIAFLLPQFPTASDRQHRSIILLMFAAVLAILANLLASPNGFLVPIILLALIAALSNQFERDRMILLAPASAAILILTLTLHLLIPTQSSTPQVALISVLLAIVATLAALAHLLGPSSEKWTAAICCLVAAIAFTAISIDERSIWLTAGILSIGSAEMLSAYASDGDDFRPVGIAPIDQVRGATALLAFGTGSAALAAIASTNGPLGWQTAGAIGAGLLGLGYLFTNWRRQQTEKLEQLRLATAESRTDSLTGLFNRRGIDERLHEEFARSHRYGHTLSILMIDLDDFKSINDRHGHPAGDQVLRNVARLIAQSIRSIDRAGRYGGEEFLVLLPETSTQGAMVVAQRIRAAVKEFGQLTVSLGLAESNSDDPTADSMLARADAALYEAKHAGKNRIVSAR